VDFLDAQCFSSLEGASFALAPAGSTPLTLVNGWVGAPFGTSPPSAAIVDGMVHLKGAISSGTNSLAFTLPAGMRPAGSIYLNTGLLVARKGRLSIAADGSVFVSAEDLFSDAQSFTSLDGVKFAPAGNTAFKPLTALNGWSQSIYTGPPEATIVRDIVYLKGSISTAGVNLFPFTLSPVLRPAGRVYTPTDLFLGAKGRFQIETDGAVQVTPQNDLTDAQNFTSLDGVSFAVPEPSGAAALMAGVGLLAGLACRPRADRRGARSPRT